MSLQNQCGFCLYCDDSGDKLRCTNKKLYKVHRKQDKSLTRKNMWSHRINTGNNCESFLLRHPKKSVLKPLLLTMSLALCIVGLFALFHQYNEDPGSPPEVPPSKDGQLVQAVHSIDSTPTSNIAVTPENMEEHYKHHILPLVEEMHKENTRAARDAIRYFKSHYRQFKAGVVPFVEDISNVGSRFTTLFYAATDPFAAPPSSTTNGKHNNRMDKFVADKFAHHVMSEAELTNLIRITLAMYMDHVEANRNILLSSIDVALRMGDIPLHEQIQIKSGSSFISNFYEQIMKEAVQRNEKVASIELVTFILTEEVSRWTNAATPLLVAGTSAQVAQTAGLLGTTAVMGGSASLFASQIVTTGLSGRAGVNMAAAGGTAGTVLGPLGTLGGVAVVGGIGLAIDCFLTKHFKKDAISDLSKVMKDLENSILKGTTGNSSKSGLITLLDETNQSLFSITQKAIRETLTSAV